MYCQMMERAVAERKGEAVAPERRATLNLGQGIRIPPEYIESENLRLPHLQAHRGSFVRKRNATEVRKELEDRFGPPPPPVENLLDYAVLKALAEKLLVASVDRRGDQLAIKFYEDTPLGADRLVKLMRKREGHAARSDGCPLAELERRHGGTMRAPRNVLLQLQS